MFTGIIKAKGLVVDIEKNNNIFSFETDYDLDDCNIGTSINCDGICLTMVSLEKNKNKFIFKVNIGEETIERSTSKYWNVGSIINLEKSLKVGDEIAGHFVYGHIDCISKILKINNLKNSWNMFFELADINNKLIVEKGSIAINGISLTIANLYKDSFCVSIIPHTYNTTNLLKLDVDDVVNLEFDMLSRYVLKNK
ncbi:MAG: Riboflavin synthase [Alphaproteobacteria bacterium MarineAlpha5_Bin12]|nr:MAG: Riboflavin synthase [Alphaproteobacteria bacterium MarineAlpha5_Bin12]|tara:strand:- start:7758 stop:8345 length:588 start_codon:yes stop_codon:yes gene_type:complete